MRADDDWGRRFTDAGMTREQLQKFHDTIQYAVVLIQTGQYSARMDVGDSFTDEQWEVMQELMDSIRGRKDTT